MPRAPRTVPSSPACFVGPAPQAESCSRRAGRSLGALLLVLALGNACASGPRTRSFVELPDHVKAGDTVRLTEVSGATLTGRAENLSSSSLTVLADSERREVPAAQVAKVERRGRNVWRGTLIGLGAGVVIGIVAFNSVEPSNPYDFYAPVGAAADAVASVVLGTGLGAVGGAFIKSFKTVYVAPPAPVQAAAQNAIASSADAATFRQWRLGTVGASPGARKEAVEIDEAWLDKGRVFVVWCDSRALWETNLLTRQRSCDRVLLP